MSHYDNMLNAWIIETELSNILGQFLFLLFFLLLFVSRSVILVTYC